MSPLVSNVNPNGLFVPLMCGQMYRTKAINVNAKQVAIIPITFGLKANCLPFKVKRDVSGISVSLLQYSSPVVVLSNLSQIRVFSGGIHSFHQHFRTGPIGPLPVLLYRSTRTLLRSAAELMREDVGGYTPAKQRHNMVEYGVFRFRRTRYVVCLLVVQTI